ncbi:MAG: glycosyltransferase family 2 protein [Gemmatimonadota bacterium]
MTGLLPQLPTPPAGRRGWPWDRETPALPPTRSDGSSWPRITVVTPSYQQATFLEETLRSVLLQSYPALEYIVVDGGSTDGSREILERYGEWLDHWVSEPDSGQSEAINKGLARSTGEVWNWLNSDDLLEPGALAAVAEGFTPTGTRAVAGWERRFGEGHPTTLHQGTPRDHPLEWTLFVGHLDQPCTYFRRMDIEELGGLDTGLHWGMDLDLYMRYLLRFGQEDIRSVDSVISNFRLHADSKTVRQEGGARQEDQVARWSFRAEWGREVGVDPEILRAVEATFPLRQVRPYRVEVELDSTLMDFHFTSELVSYFYFQRRDEEARHWLARLRANPFHRWDRRSLVLHARLHLLPAPMSRILAGENPYLSP